MNSSILHAVALLLILACAGRSRAAESVVYQNDFESTSLNEVPDEFLILDGDFSVREGDGNQFLELPGSPLETFAVLFGPNEREGIAVAARIYATNKGRRYPAFGVGLNGVAGYRLMLAPAKKSIELYRDAEVVASVPYQWKPGAWIRLSLEVRQTNAGSWTIRGKAWLDDQPEPEDWSITATDVVEPFSGNASIWGKPFSGTSIRYDDLKVLRLEPRREEF